MLHALQILCTQEHMMRFPNKLSIDFNPLSKIFVSYLKLVAASFILCCALILRTKTHQRKMRAFYILLWQLLVISLNKHCGQEGSRLIKVFEFVVHVSMSYAPFSLTITQSGGEMSFEFLTTLGGLHNQLTFQSKNLHNELLI